MLRLANAVALSALFLLAVDRSLQAQTTFVLLHEGEGESPLGVRAFVLFMVGLLFVVLFFDHLAARAIRSIRKHRRSGFASRFMKRTPQTLLRMKKLLAKARR